MQLAQDAAADAVLASEPFVLVVGMLLDQQVPMERAFGGAARLHERLRKEHGGLVPTAVAAMDPEQLAEICAAPPAVHRFPAAMARRIHALAVHVRAAYDGDATSLWRSADTGDELAARLRSLPGFGPQKAQIFLALLGKQLGIQPEGWREAAGPYGATGSHLSVADVVDAASLAQVRAYKQEQKQAKARSKGSA
jgi:uncharacterized HhH-GPD family protein